MRALGERVAGEVNPYVYFAAASVRPHGTHTLTRTHTCMRVQALIVCTYCRKEDLLLHEHLAVDGKHGIIVQGLVTP
jgi:hypothetical protein